MSIAEKANDIRSKKYGREVREALASGIEEINTIAESANSKSNSAKTIAESVTAAEIERINKEKTRIENERNRQADFYTIKTDYTTYKNIMTAESNVAALQNNIDKITNGLGGRNLVLDSLNMDKKASVSGIEATFEKVLDPIYTISGTVLKITCTKSGGGIIYLPIFPQAPRRVGKTYTWSCSINSNMSKDIDVGHQSGSNKKVQLYPKTLNQISHTWLFLSRDVYTAFYISCENFEVGDILYISDLKIEEGTVASTFTLAPEDAELKQNAINLSFDLRITALEAK